MTHPLRTCLALLAVGGLLTTLRAQDKPVAPATAAADPTAPKPLSVSVKRGLDYLVRQQDASGGWGQGGGWRVGQQGRVEGTELKDPPDVGNTSIAVLALVRAGNTPKSGAYAKEVARAADFICNHVQKSDDKSLYVSDIKGTQIQSKIGPYVDTFLASMVLAELKGKMADEKGDQMLLAALTKTVSKIEKNQQADGTFKGNEGWATVLSQGLANKGLNRAAQNGVAVQVASLNRIQSQVAGNYDAKTRDFKAASPANPPGDNYSNSKNARAPGRGGAQPQPQMPTAPSDAGVPIYNASSNLTNAADVTNTLRLQEKMAKQILADKNASKEAKKIAEDTVLRCSEAEKLCEDATQAVLKRLDQPEFVQGFGSNGGEEFLSYMNISEALLLKGGADWKKWDKSMSESLTRIQDRDGSWSGHHCITGRMFCTATALLVLMADRAPVTATHKNEAASK